ncbi:MAG: hypothetical protein ACRENA_06945 [Vulcanimicrobiaceae bacterium]
MVTERLSAREVTPEDIRLLISSHQAELNELEFKRNADSDLIKAACAISNSGGGYILEKLLFDTLEEWPIKNTLDEAARSILLATDGLKVSA